MIFVLVGFGTLFLIAIVNAKTVQDSSDTSDFEDEEQASAFSAKLNTDTRV